MPAELETTVKAGARAMADGKILDQTTVLGSPKLVGGGLQAGEAG